MSKISFFIWESITNLYNLLILSLTNYLIHMALIFLYDERKSENLRFELTKWLTFSFINLRAIKSPLFSDYSDKLLYLRPLNNNLYRRCREEYLWKHFWEVLKMAQNLYCTDGLYDILCFIFEILASHSTFLNRI